MSVTHDFILRQIRGSFPKHTKLSILDYGCGNGELVRIISQEVIAKYQGWEVSDSCLKQAKEMFGGKKYSFQKIDRQNLPQFGKNKFDIVTFIGVMQYMRDRELTSILKQTRLALKNKGILLITTTTDHFLYKLFNLYRIFLPHKYLNRTELVNMLVEHGFTVSLQQERGILITPLFSNIITLFFDVIDRFVLGKRGELGFFGKSIRQIFYPLMVLEQRVPIDFGHTLFIRATRKPL